MQCCAYPSRQVAVAVNFVRWRLMIVGPQYVTFPEPIIWRWLLGFWENLYIAGMV